MYFSLQSITSSLQCNYKLVIPNPWLGFIRSQAAMLSVTTRHLNISHHKSTVRLSVQMRKLKLREVIQMVKATRLESRTRLQFLIASCLGVCKSSHYPSAVQVSFSVNAMLIDFHTNTTQNNAHLSNRIQLKCKLIFWLELYYISKYQCFSSSL